MSSGHPAAMSGAKAEILQLAKAYQYQLHPAALKRLLEVVGSNSSGSIGSGLDENSRQLLLQLFYFFSSEMTASTSSSSPSGTTGLAKQQLGSRLVTIEKVTTGLHKLLPPGGGVRGTTSQVLKGEHAAVVQVVTLQTLPTIIVDDLSGTTTVVTPSSSSSVPCDRMSVLQQRYQFALLRCLRKVDFYVNRQQQQRMQNDEVDRRDQGGTTTTIVRSNTNLPLLPIAALDGISATLRVAVLGVLVVETATSDGGGGGGENWVLEDPRCRLLLDVSATDLVCLQRGGLFCAGMLVVAVGRWISSKFAVDELRMPPGETREGTLDALPTHSDYFGLAPPSSSLASLLVKEKSAVQSVICVLAHVHLDHPPTVHRLSVFFKEFEQRSEADLHETTFVLVGDFCSAMINFGEISHLSDAGSTGKMQFQLLLDNLAHLLHTSAPNVAAHAHFIFVPGPNDPSALVGAVPQPPIPSAFTAVLRQRLKRCTFSSNPCRLRFLTQEIIVCRMDMYHSILEKCFKSSSSSAGRQQPDEEVPVAIDDGIRYPKAPFPYERVLKTVVDQAHLFPHDDGNVLWKYDAALRLTPLPHTLILCDRTEQWECQYMGMKAVNPGSFSASRTFLWYTPSDKEHTLNTVE